MELKLPILKGTQAKYNALPAKDEATIYITTDTGMIYLGTLELGKTTAILLQLSQIADAVENVRTSIPEVVHSAGSSLEAVISQSGVTNLIAGIASGSGFIHPQDAPVATVNDLPTDAKNGDAYYITELRQWKFFLNGEWYRFTEIDLSEYARTTEVGALIKAVTGLRDNLTTVDKTTLVAAINELKTRIDTKADASDLATTNSRIDGIDTVISGLENAFQIGTF